jgi:hypothetical protein
MYAMDNQPPKPDIHPLFAKYLQAVKTGHYEIFSPDKLSLKAEMQTHDELSQLTDTERVKLKSIAEQQYEESRLATEKNIRTVLKTGKEPKDDDEWAVIERSRITLKILRLFLTKAYWCKLHMKANRSEQPEIEQIKIKQKEKGLTELFENAFLIFENVFLNYEKLSPNVRNPQHEDKVRIKLEKLTPSQRTKLLQEAHARYELNMMKRKIYTEFDLEYCSQEISLGHKLKMDLLKSMMPRTAVLYNSK